MKKKRRESFFGMHFDFHAKPGQTNIGEFCDYDAVDLLLREVKPDYIQCDTKGHNGISSYPTKVGNPAPQMKGDILKMWREVTEKYDVALYAHHSGVLDAAAVAGHPEWAALNVEGKMSDQKWETSVFSPYVDELLIPQLIEIANEWRLDGAWVDGECWGAIEDYSEWARAAYKKETGLDLPAEDDAGGREKFREFCRDGFRRYLDHYCDEVHRRAPGFEIASNWMFTSYTPDRPNGKTDFISGDYSQKDSMRTAFFEGRALQNSKCPWDLMAWGFNERCTKETSQLCAEAAAVIALGGGFQVYNPQLIGSVQKCAIPIWKKTAEFCREREDVCHKATPHHEGAVLLSSRAIQAHKQNLFRWASSWNPSPTEYGLDTHGLLYALLDAGYSTEVLLSYQFDDMSDGELSQYAFIAVSNLDVIEENIRERLGKYVKNGGNVVICGVDSASIFAKELGVKILGIDADIDAVYPFTRGRRGMLKSSFLDVAVADADVIGRCSLKFSTNDTESKIFSTRRRDGKGAWIGIYSNFGLYKDAASAGARDAIEDAISSVYPRKAVEISGTHEIQVILTEKNGALNVNLLNVSGHHSDPSFANFDEITPMYNIAVSIAYPNEPSCITEMPSGRKLDFCREDGRITLTLDKLEIHSVIVIK